MLPILSVVVGCSDARPLVEREPAGKPGLPPTVSRIVVALAGSSVVDCTGTLIHERWVLTSAHCFSGAPAQNFATIRALGASVRIEDILVHPEATFDGDPIAGQYMNPDIVAAHDLAMMPLRFAIMDEPVATFWEPGQPVDDALAELSVSYARSYAGDPYTVVAAVNGLVDASELLSGDQPERLLAATGPAPAAGDSGGGAFVAPAGASDATPQLVGVVQDAPLDVSVGRFGLVPVWTETHREFIEQAIANTGE